MDLTDQEVGPTNMGELAVAGVAKYAGERALMPIVGDANLYSGLTKLAIGVGTDSVVGNNTIGRGVALGVGIDGVEDLLTVIGNQTNATENLMGAASSATGGVM